MKPIELISYKSSDKDKKLCVAAVRFIKVVKHVTDLMDNEIYDYNKSSMRISDFPHMS